MPAEITNKQQGAPPPRTAGLENHGREATTTGAEVVPIWRPKVYIDTSVVSAYFDDRTPERQKLTRSFWESTLSKFEGMVSTSVLQEVEATPSESRRSDMLDLVAPLQVLALDEPAENLAYEYQERGIFDERTVVDGLHVAIAVIHGVEYLVSWNYNHLVRVSTRREVNLVNSLKGYGQIEIIAPPEL